MNLSRCREIATYKLLIILDKHLHLLKICCLPRTEQAVLVKQEAENTQQVVKAITCLLG